MTSRLRTASVMAAAALLTWACGDDGSSTEVAGSPAAGGGTPGSGAGGTGNVGNTGGTGSAGTGGDVTGGSGGDVTGGSGGGGTESGGAAGSAGTGGATGGDDGTGGAGTGGIGTAGSGGTGGTSDCAGTLVFANDFNDDPVGTYTEANLEADWNNPSWDNGVGEGRVEIIEGGDAYDGRSLRVHYPQGGVGPSEGGAQWQLALGSSYDELFLSYRIRFAPGFDFVLGGKIPGLVGGTAPTGCIPDDTGFSARGMWRTGGEAVQYMYYPNKVNACGDDFDYRSGGNAVLFQAGTWHVVEHRLVMNTPGQTDGILQAWFDGQMVLDVQDFEYRLSDGNYSIDGMYFSTFFGGSDATWAPTKSETIDYDDFLICTGPITH